jgi:hypothetical protein
LHDQYRNSSTIRECPFSDYTVGDDLPGTDIKNQLNKKSGLSHREWSTRPTATPTMTFDSEFDPYRGSVEQSEINARRIGWRAVGTE